MDQKTFNKTPSQGQAESGKGFAQKPGTPNENFGVKTPPSGDPKSGGGISTLGNKVDPMDANKK